MFFAVSIGDANMDVLKQIAKRDPLHLKGLRFRDLFSWLSNSLSSVSRSNPGDNVQFVNPVTPPRVGIYRMTTAAKWKFARASVVGTSHARTGAPCQDVNACEVLTDSSGNETLVVVVSDGAGSARRAEIGAALACQLFISEMQAFFESSHTAADLTRDFARKWITSFQSDIQLRADAEELKPRDFACTLVAAVISDDNATFLQLGDGAIVVRSDDEPDDDNYAWVFWAEEGEYANQTTFLTEAAAFEKLNFQTVNHRVDEVALFSDGLQRLALHFQSRTAHAPFFESMFAPLHTVSVDGHAAGLSASLTSFLDSPSINERTDDDKTLVLATRRVYVESSTDAILLEADNADNNEAGL
jgi:hypothetical protein